MSAVDGKAPPTLWYCTERNAAWYAALLAAPLRVSTPLAALYEPVMPLPSVKSSRSSEATKPAPMVTVAPVTVGAPTTVSAASTATSLPSASKTVVPAEAAMFGATSQVRLPTLHWLPAAQSEVTAQPFAAGTHEPLAAQALVVHWAELVHAVDSPVAQVLVVPLHAPLLQTALALPAVQVPSCRPSLEIATPAASFAWQVKVVREQNWLAEQSASTSQPPVGMQLPPALQVPLWHTAPALAGVQGPSPLP